MLAGCPLPKPGPSVVRRMAGTADGASSHMRLGGGWVGVCGGQGHLPGQPGSPGPGPCRVLRGVLRRRPVTPHSPCPCAPRAEWAQARQAFFSSGKNKAALDAIERAAFFVALDEESPHYDPEDEASLSLYGKALLHGNCYNRCGTPAPQKAPAPSPCLGAAPHRPASPASFPAGGLTSLSLSSPSRTASWASTRNTRGQTHLS